jgi:ubiquilin
MQQQLLQNPQVMRDLMNSPMMQSVMNNPELLRFVVNIEKHVRFMLICCATRSILLSNPEMRSIIERNPEVGHVLNDPQMLRQTMEMARNPELMREMMRNTDRAMSNIESHPEGFNLLRRMYTNVQEPMMNAVTQPQQQQQQATSAPNNPFAALFSQPQQPQTPLGSTSGTTVPNTAPLPNPWGGGTIHSFTKEFATDHFVFRKRCTTFNHNSRWWQHKHTPKC